MSDIGTWYRSLPVFTRSWLSLSLVFTLLGRFGFFKPHQVILLYEPFIKNFQVISFQCLYFLMFESLLLT